MNESLVSTDFKVCGFESSFAGLMVEVSDSIPSSILVVTIPLLFLTISGTLGNAFLRYTISITFPGPSNFLYPIVVATFTHDSEELVEFS